MNGFTEEELQALREAFEEGMRENGFDDFSFRMTGKMYTHQIVEERKIIIAKSHPSAKLNETPEL